MIGHFLIMENCYMCDSPACSREHVPPRNLFPEAKDVDGTNYRVNLITVPSCRIHNSAKSHDDEFLMVSLAGIVGNNSIGIQHRFGKVDRAIRRSSYQLLEKIFRKKDQVSTINLKDNKFIEIIWGTPNIDRLTKCFEHIARGLYFHHFHSKFSGNVTVYLGYLSRHTRNSQEFDAMIKNKIKKELDGSERYGDNPKVFFYQVTPQDKFGLFLFRLCFYGGLNVYVTFLPNEISLPPNIATELIANGIKTYIGSDSQIYEFN